MQLWTQFKQLRIEVWKSQDFNVEVAGETYARMWNSRDTRQWGLFIGPSRRLCSKFGTYTREYFGRPMIYRWS